MFDNLQKVKIYEEALKLLADPSISDREVWVHDYKEPCYRKKKSYTLNGLHWGYPDSIVDSITRKMVNGVRSFYYATFVGTLPRDAEKWNYADNSRFSKIKYKEIKEIVELGIRQKLKQARIDSQEDVKALKSWKKYIQKEYSQYNGAALRIEEVKNKIKLVALKPERFNTYGFGSFLEDIKPGDISISPKTLEILAHCSERGGINGLELFANNILGMIGTEPLLEVHQDSISVVKPAHRWLPRVAKVE